MLFYQIYVLGLLLLLCDPDRVESSQSLLKEMDESLSIPVDENSFETAHRIPNVKEEFETSHKISSASDSQYRNIGNVDENAESSLMQLQQTQNLFSTKERPELSPILSALINEDVMKSIEAKRAIEQQQLDAISAEMAMLQTTEGLSYVLTTSKPPLDKNIALEDEANVGLVDQPINLESAGSENNQKSRIQIKKGPNGMDYEYEYVYYYYDDDEAAESKKYQEAEPTNQGTNKKGTQPLERGKSRYTNIERSTTSAPDNTLVSGKAKGRANLDDSNTVDEGRLPVMTRFPSRGKNIEANPTDSLDGFGNVASASIEKSQKIGVKRPSLELVDSETFNTDEKQIKGSPRNGDSEKTTPSAIENIDAKETKKEETSDEKALLAEEVDQTTPLMEKSALDLYAILARENLEIEMTTDLNKVITTDLPDSTESDDYGITTVEPETDTVIPATSSSTTTTEEPLSTTSTTTTTTTTTTTLAPSLFGAGRRGIATTGRNRFRLKSGTATAGPATATVNEASAAPAADQGNANGIKERNRFQRPSLSNRKGAFTTSPAPSAAEEEVIAKEIDKPVVSSSPVRGRTRNRFNLRGQSSTTTTIAPVKDSEENFVSTTTVRSLRARPALNLHGRSRVGTRSTAAPLTSDKEEISSSVTAAAPEINDEKTAPSSLPTRPSRFSINRTGGTPGSNRLFPRPRLNPARSNQKSSTAAEEPEKAKTIKEEEGEEEEKEESDDSGKPESDSITAAPATGGLNRLKSRPRLQLQTKSDNKPKALPITARKVNPLFARKKIVLGSSTTETTISENAEDDRENSALPLDKKDTDSNQFATEEVPENNTELPETTTKLARGLGLLTQRKRLQIRKPGTQL